MTAVVALMRRAIVPCRFLLACHAEVSRDVERTKISGSRRLYSFRVSRRRHLLFNLKNGGYREHMACSFLQGLLIMTIRLSDMIEIMTDASAEALAVALDNIV
jgi:hypothetical protein